MIISPSTDLRTSSSVLRTYITLSINYTKTLSVAENNFGWTIPSSLKRNDRGKLNCIAPICCYDDDRYDTNYRWEHGDIIITTWSVLFCSLAFLDPRVGHTMDVLSPFISILCHSNWLFHRESCPRFDVVYPGRAWSSSLACTWHCSLHYFFLQAIPLFPHGVTIVC